MCFSKRISICIRAFIHTITCRTLHVLPQTLSKRVCSGSQVSAETGFLRIFILWMRMPRIIQTSTIHATHKSFLNPMLRGILKHCYKN